MRFIITISLLFTIGCVKDNEAEIRVIEAQIPGAVCATRPSYGDVQCVVDGQTKICTVIKGKAGCRIQGGR